MSQFGTVLVTGATGQIGRRVVENLTALGFQVRAGLHRSPLPKVWSRDAKVEGRTLDLSSPASIDEALAGCRGLVHAAWSADDAIASDVRRLWTSAEKHAVRVATLVSSIAVYGNRSGTITDDTRPSPIGAYAVGKAAAENIVRESGVGSWILRPGVVVGPGSPLWVDKLGRRLKVGAVGALSASEDGICPLVDVRDVGGFAALSMVTQSRPQSVNVVSPTPPNWRDYLKGLAAVLDLPAPEPTTTAALRRAGRTRLVGKVLGKVGLASGSVERSALALTSDEVDLLTRRATYPSDPLPLFGRDYQFGLEQTLDSLRP